MDLEDEKVDKRAIKDALPVMAGYFPIAMTYGILAGAAGIDGLDGVLVSVFVYAGASQFMAVGMYGAGVSMVGIISAVFLMNFRHFIMSASLKAKLKETKKKHYPVIGFFLTDETYSVISMREDVDKPSYLITLEILCYSAWVLGTVAGYLFGMFIPEVITGSMGIALYALLVSLLVPSCKRSRGAVIAAGGAGIVNTLLGQATDLGFGSAFMISVLGISAICALFDRQRMTSGEVADNEL